MSAKTLVFDDGNRRKFWEIRADGCVVETAWGRVGTDGQRKRKQLPSRRDAEAYVARLLRQKLDKGYVVTPHSRLRRVREATRALARDLVFVETGGGPVLVLPVDAAKDWNGVYDDAGEYIFEERPCDYDRACSMGLGVSSLPVGGWTALVMGSIGPVAWHPLSDGGLLLLWIESDTTAALLEVATSLRASQVKKTRHRLVVGASSQVLLLDAAKRGRSPGSCEPADAHGDYRYAEAHPLSIAPGTYAVHYAGAVRETVVDGESTAEACVEVARLRRVD